MDGSGKLRFALLAAVLAMTSSINAQADPYSDAWGAPASVWIEHIGGDPYGARPYTGIGTEVFPLSDGWSSLMLHASGRVSNERRGGASAGLHHRVLFDGGFGPAIFGAGVWYDLTQTRFNNRFQQGSFSAELLMPLWSFRANGYHPIGPSDRNAAIVQTYDPARFTGHHLVVDPRTIFFDEEALRSVEVEVARSLLEESAEGYAGYYRLDGDRTGGVNGVKVGFRGFFTDCVSGSLTVAHDDLFDTSVFGSLTVTFGSAGKLPLRFSDRLLSRVQRNSQVVVSGLRREFIGNPITLTNNGAPIEFNHVNSSAVAGNGTFETPFAALSDANSDPDKANRDVVYVHADSTFSNQFYELSPNQRLLGEGDGVEHQVTTDQFGQVVLPAGSGGVAAPVIDLVDGAAITANDTTEISNFVITGSGTGLRMPALNGDVDVSNLRFAGNNYGIVFANFAGSFRSHGPIQIDNSSVAGVNVDGGTSAITFDELTIDQSLGSGLLVSNFSGAVNVIGPTSISNVTEDGIRIDMSAPAAFTFGDLTVDTAGDDGLDLATMDGLLNSTGVTTVSAFGDQAIVFPLGAGTVIFAVPPTIIP
jgi:hypothetical protein